MTVLRWLAGAAAAVVLAGTWSSVIRTLVVPRGTTSRLTRLVGAAVRGAFFAVTDRCERYEVRDRTLAYQGPVTLLLILAVWLLAYVLGYTLLSFAVGGGAGITVAAAFRETGSSLFTLGFASSERLSPTVVDFAAAATGPVVVALQIAYLPTIYAAYNRRETEVTLLQSRAGEPAWGPELLARHQLVDIMDDLPHFFANWERWAADVAESHTNYPVLVDFRSPVPPRSWIVSLVAVLDAAAIYLAVCPGQAPSQARLCLRMGFSCLRDIAAALRLPYVEDPRPDDDIALGYEEFLTAVRRLHEVGLPMERNAETAWPHFRGWRVNYEATAYAIAARVEAVPALWSGPRRRAGSVMIPHRPPNRTPAAPEEAYPPSYGRRLDN